MENKKVFASFELEARAKNAAVFVRCRGIFIIEPVSNDSVVFEPDGQMVPALHLFSLRNQSVLWLQRNRDDKTSRHQLWLSIGCYTVRTRRKWAGAYCPYLLGNNFVAAATLGGTAKEYGHRHVVWGQLLPLFFALSDHPRPKNRHRTDAAQTPQRHVCVCGCGLLCG